MMVAYYYRNKRDVRLFMEYEQWNERNLKAKGCSSSLLFLRRDMTPMEGEDYSGCRRLHFEIYTCWDALLQDEARVEVPDEFIGKIVDFSKTHSLPGQSLELAV